MNSNFSDLNDYNFSLDPSFIARFPKATRSSSRLLILDTLSSLKLIDSFFYELPKYLLEDDILVLNHTHVSQRKMDLVGKNGKVYDVLFVNKRKDKNWECLVRGKKKLKIGDSFYVKKDCEIHFIFQGSDKSNQYALFFPYAIPNKNENVPSHFLEQDIWKDTKDAENFFQKYGQAPIPPYFQRKAKAEDKLYYQTVYAEGESKAISIAAPTAGLHFTKELLSEIKKKGVQVESLELEIGLGTFSPLREENFTFNRLHKEIYQISPKLSKVLNGRKKRRIIAVGTTSLRALEANYREHQGVFQSGHFATDLFLKPPDQIYSIQGLITNFHLPASSLLLLVASYVGKEAILASYQHAMKKKYSFYSYGDAMFIRTAIPSYT